MSEDLREEFLRAMQPQPAKVGVVVRPVDKLAEVVAGVDDPAGESVRRTSDDLIDQLDRSIAISPALLGMSAKRRQPLSALIAPRESLGHGGTNEFRVDADHGDSGAVELVRERLRKPSDAGFGRCEGGDVRQPSVGEVAVHSDDAGPNVKGASR